jgi:hypothetical protein
VLTLSPLFAIAAPLDPLGNTGIPEAPASNLLGLGMRDIFLILGVAVALGLFLFIWVYVAHKGRRRHHSKHQPSKPVAKADKKSPEMSSSKGPRIRRRRRGHPDNLPRNPTLGETGGLPPIRPEEPPSEVAQQ